MELHLEVVLLSTIKSKKPWPRFCWLGLEKESVFLLDDNRISEINMVSGRTKKKIPKLQPLLQRVVTMAVSQNGMWLTGLLVSGEAFLWSKDRGCLKTINTVLAVSQLVTAAHEASARLSLLVSGDGRRVLLTALTGQVFLWECSDPQSLSGTRDGIAKGRWQQILPLDTSALPSLQNKEASQHSMFARGEAVGDCCLSAFLFNVGEQLKVTFLKIQWDEGLERTLSPVGYSVRWVTETYPLTQLSPPCRPVRSRGALIPAFSPDGQLLAIALNQRDPRATQVLFVSTQNFVSVSSWLGGCGSRNLSIPSKYVRSYWVAGASWTQGGLYLACVLKRGSFLLLARLGGLISLSTSGCSVELGPAHFLPLHPLVTYRLPAPLIPQEVSPTSSCASRQDVLRQRYSVTWHPRLPYLIVSDGYMATVLRVPINPSPAALVGTLLTESVEGLERVRKGLAHVKPQMRMLLESMSTLKLTASLQELRKQEVALSTIPLFLQDETDTRDIQELYARTQCTGEDDSDEEGSQFPGTRAEDRGRLEFASMFDSLHAHPNPHLHDLHDPEYPEETPDAEGATLPLLVELDRVQRSLLTAWAISVSMGGVLEDRGRLLRYAVNCAVRLMGLFQLLPLPGPRGVEQKCNPWASRVLPLFRSLFSLLPWDSSRAGGDSCLGVAVELARRIIRLFLSPPPDSLKHRFPGLFSKTLSSAILVLRLASQILDLTYCLPKSGAHHPHDLKGEPIHPFPPSDVFSVPFLQEAGVKGVSQNALLAGQRPSSRFLGVWRVLYRQALQYRADMLSQTGRAPCPAEQGRISHILSQIQQVLQGAGDQLGGASTLHSVAGEQLFLSGSYAESAQVWRAELHAERERGGALTCILETRYCLALLYGELSQYRLREAQGLCEHLARQLVRQTWSAVEDRAEPAEDREQLSAAWPPVDVGREAACAVVQSFGRFMAAYFTNQPLTILPPHCVEVLPPLHLPPAVGQRLVPLSQSTVLGEVRQQHLSEVWTVDYTLDLLLQGGLLPEAVWLAHSLGDWKTAASLGLAYTSYCRDQFDLTRLKWRELHLPAQLQPGCIFQDQLECLLGLDAGPLEDQSGTDRKPHKRFTDSMEEEDTELLQVSVQEILKASVMAQVDVSSQPLHRLLEAAKDLASCLSGLVPPGVYLPAPPLYCPQPATDIEVPTGDVGSVSERASRQRISAVLQRALLLLRSARCSLSAAQWYITNLQRCRQLLHKKCAQPSNPFPDGLMDFVTSGGFFSSENYGEGCLDAVTVQVIACFRELCGLCWMLHVRDQLSASCRKYQAARNRMRGFQGSDSVCYVSGSDVVQCCTDTLLWACRLLPFSRFLKADEVLQDLVLSLVSELPPSPMVVEVLARVFPEEEESVQVSLREKYSALLQRLRHCTLPASECGSAQEEEREEMVTVLIQERLSLRRQNLRQVAKRLGPLKSHIWERIEEDEEGATPAFDRFSLGASLSRSTLSDCGRSPMHSDGDAAAPDLVSSDDPARPSLSSKRREGPRGSDASAGRRDESRHAESGGVAESPAPPPVGTWEFELSDEEYPRFLELLFSYVLERDRSPGEDSALPLLSCFSPQLRERELHSLAFDVLTTFKRRQREQRHAAGRKSGGDHRPPPPPSTPNLSVQNEAQLRGRAASSVHLLPGLRAGKPQGLFGLRQQGWPVRLTPAQGTRAGSEASQSSTVGTPQSDYRALPTPDTLDLQQETDPKLEARFRDLGRLLEWMVRWADRRVLLGHPPRTRTTGTGVAAEGVVMRVKASTSAVLTALGVLERRYTAALLGTDKHCPYFRVPEGEFIVAPVQPAVVRKTRGVDPGCAESAGSPVPSPVLETPHGASEASEVEELEPEVDPGGEVHQYGQEGATPDPENEARQAQGGSQDEPAEPEGEHGVEGAWEAEASASCISVKIRALPRVPINSQDQTLTVADLESDTDETQGDLSQAVISGSLQLPASMPTSESADSMEVAATIPTSDGATGTRPVPGPHPGPAVPQNLHTSNAPQPERTPDTQPPLALSDPVRRLIQDESFRLMQFQHVSFINLLQVMGASFTNPLLLNQTQQTGASFLQPRPQASDQTGQQNSGPATQSREERPDDREPLRTDRHGSLNPVSVSQCQRNIENVNEDIQEFPVHPQESRGSQTERQTCIPSAYGLNTASPESTHVPPGLHHGLPLLFPGGHSQHGSSANGPVTKIKLLQLHPPQALLPWPPPVAASTSLLRTSPAAPLPKETGCAARRGEPTPSARFGVGRDDPSTLRTAAEERKEAAERAFAVPPKRISLEQRVHTTRTAWPEPKASDGSVDGRGGGAPLNLLLDPQYHRPPPPQGLPLLHFDSSPLAPVSLAPLATFARPLASGLGCPSHCPSIQLLQRDPEPPSKVLPLTLPPLQAPHLIPLEVLMAWAAQGQREPPTGVTRHHLLVGDTRTGLADSAANLSKRQKRRDEKRKGAGTGATFRLEGSNARPTEPEKVEPSGSAVEEAFVPSAESLGSLLATQSLASRALSTAAELHAFASSQKKPPEIQDVSTNTDPVAPCSVTDKAISVQLPVCQPTSPQSGGLQTEIAAAPPCPDVFLNLQFPMERLSQESGSPGIAQQVVDMHGAGRHFINVIDLEDGDLLQHLPSVHIPVPENGPPPLPTSSGLHPRAAPVSGSTPPDLPTGDRVAVDTVQDAQPEPSGKSPPRAAQGPVWEPAWEKAPLGPLMENEVCITALLTRQQGDMGVEESRSQDHANAPTTDDLLASQQSITDHMDRGLANSRMPMSAMESFGSGVGLRDEGEQCYSWGVGVGETTEGFDTMTEMSEKEKSEKVDDHLGLSDVADILGELVGVRGVSASLLGLSDTQAAGLVRPGGQQREVRADRERQKVRAWMRRKQRERLADYCRQREERREREHRPFTPSATKEVAGIPLKERPLNPSSKDISLNMKMKEKNERRLRLEHHAQRAHDACSLISELLTTSPALTATAMAPMSQSGSQGTRRAAAQRSSKPDGRKGRSAHFQTSAPSRLPSPGRTSAGQRRQTHGGQLGLHRPASGLPGDRLSQVTRRGMLADPRARAPAKDRRKGVGPSLAESSRTGEEELREENEVVSPWNPPLEIRRILGLDEMSPEQDYVDEGNESTRREGAAWLKRLESLSESTGSILSKLDWTAIENMVAEEEV